MSKTVGMLTLGCKVNTYESEYIRTELENRGYEIKEFNEVCDIYIINTCTVTNSADSKSKKIIRRAINQNPKACIVAMGCFIEANHDFNFTGIDIVVGNKNKNQIPDLIDEYLKNKQQIIKLYDNKDAEWFNEFEDMDISSFPGRTRAFIKIQDGCDNYCTFCIIPFVRGKVRSKSKEKVIEEIKRLVDNNYKEVVLTGIHTGSYGEDKDYTFADLLNEIVKIKGLERLRISSIEVNELKEEVLDVIRNSEIIVDHLHIPLQAGSNEILHKMKRKYNLDQFKNKINQIRKIRPDISISTDIIVGFPGETEELFTKTLQTSREIGFSKIHVFPYSERKGTKAEELPNHLPGNIKKDYSKRLIHLSKELEISYAEKFINQELEVLVENSNKGYSYGHTKNFIYIKIKGEIKNNTNVMVKLTKIEYPHVIGELI